MTPALVWLIVALLIVGGIVGAVVPGLPGAPLIFLGAVVLEVFLPQYLSVWTLVTLGVLAALSGAADIAFTAAGGRAMGATRYGVLGAAAGAVVGFVFGPMGLVLGAFAGAVVGELALAGRAPGDALRAGLGAWLGLLASTAAKAVIAGAMVLIFLADAFLIG